MRSPSRQARRAGVRSRLVALVGSVLLLAGLVPAATVVPVLASHTTAPTSVTIAGSLQSELGCSADWQPECAATHLTYDATDTVWQGTFAVPSAATAYDYKAALNDAWTENYGANATFNGGNIGLTVGDANATKFYYSHDSHWITSNRNASIATAAGSFQSEIGCPGDWQPDCLRSWLQDPDGNGVYTFVSDEIPAGDYEMKVALNEAWDVSYPASNVAFTVAADEVVTITYTASTNAVTVVSEPPPAPDTTVALVGSLQEELGCPGDWQPECAATQLTYDASDSVWQGDVHGARRQLGVQGRAERHLGRELRRERDAERREHRAEPGRRRRGQVLLRPRARTGSRATATRRSRRVPGRFQRELGCPGDWQPDCLRSWLQDPDGDGTYTFTTRRLPAGDYEAKVAHNESWDVNYGAGGVANGPNIAFTVPDADVPVTFSYDLDDARPDDLGRGRRRPGARRRAAGAAEPARRDRRGLLLRPARPLRQRRRRPTTRAACPATGSRPASTRPTRASTTAATCAGLIDRLDYLEGLGITAIWMAPMFKNRPVQGTGADASAGYHGYWITDFTQLDPHFGTNAELRELVDGAHARGIKVFFDVITNHTADVIDYAEGTYDYVSKAEEPYWDADGLEFDDADYAGSDDFPALNLQSFPYTPVFPTAADATVKVPAWLNDRTMYHNRGDSTFVGENAHYGDFFGLDDLFTERPEVVDGMIDIFSDWVTDVGIDGYRIDTVKHVNDEFWQEWAPALVQHAASEGIDDFFMFGEVFDSNPAFTSHYTKDAQAPGRCSTSRSRAGRRSFAVRLLDDGPARPVRATTTCYTDADSNAYSLPTFLGNHDMGRIGKFLRTDNAGATDAELLARDKLAHSLMYLVPRPAGRLLRRRAGLHRRRRRQGRAAGHVPEPGRLVQRRRPDRDGRDHGRRELRPDASALPGARRSGRAAGRPPALREGAQIHRYATGDPGVYAFSRILHDEQIEYVVALNNAETPQTGAGADVLERDGLHVGLRRRRGGDDRRLGPAAAHGAGALRRRLPRGRGAAAEHAQPDRDADGARRGRRGRRQRRARGRRSTGRSSPRSRSRSRPATATEWTVLGTDDNPPYRIFHDVSGLAAGTPLAIKAIARDRSGNLDSDTATAVVGEVAPPPAGRRPRLRRRPLPAARRRLRRLGRPRLGRRERAGRRLDERRSRSPARTSTAASPG